MRIVATGTVQVVAGLTQVLLQESTVRSIMAVQAQARLALGEQVRNLALMRHMAGQTVIGCRLMHFALGEAIEEITVAFAAQVLRVAHEKMLDLPLVREMTRRALAGSEWRMHTLAGNRRRWGSVVTARTEFAHRIGQQHLLR